MITNYTLLLTLAFATCAIAIRLQINKIAINKIGAVAPVRNMFISICLLLCFNANSQTVYYPAKASKLLQTTANDMAMLLQKAIKGSSFTTLPYTSLPATGIVLIYDSTGTGNQFCKVKGNGNGFISFSAPQDNGLNFGIYQYIQQLGFRFYQPGSIWEIIPVLSSPYKNIDTTYTCQYKYKNWFISGGHNAWAMDNDNSYYWETYFGENGHQWSLYQRRNNMTGAYRFTGHRDDIMTADYLTQLKNNPCYVGPYNNSRVATLQSVPDVNNTAAMQLWGTGIEQKFSTYKNTIFNNKDVYANYYRNFSYNNEYVGIEVPDGAHWANTMDNNGCGTKLLLKASDQHFTLANFITASINNKYPDKKFQLYAYDSHADIPSANININSAIDVQVVATAFQNESSAKGLLNRWYGKSTNISEYHYLNLPQWSGETPSFYLQELKTTLQRLKEKNSQGIVWEASPAKFASLPFLLAANTQLKDGILVDSSLHEFCYNLFGNGAASISKLLQLWGDDKTVTVSNGIQDNKYKMSLYFQLVNEADNLAKNDPAIIKQRLNELKAYLHYMQLFYDWTFDQQSYKLKATKAATLCLYLAKINRLQVVNSFYLISDIVNKYQPSDSIYLRYNTINGTAYQNGNLPLITTEEINVYFAKDLQKEGDLINQFSFATIAAIKADFDKSNLVTVEKIDVFINFTYGKDYASRSEIDIKADKAGSFQIKYSPQFGMPQMGYINFTVEAADKTTGIVKDFSIDRNGTAGILYVALPAAGTYKLTVTTKYKSALALTITTNGNYFYRNGPFLGNTIENYRGNLLSLPGYFHVPSGLKKVYFSINNSNPGGMGYATAAAINAAFLFKDNNNNPVTAKLVNSNDSALFYLDIPAGSDGYFWKAFKMEQYRFCFSNISNVQWYAAKKACTIADFKITVENKSGNCVTKLSSIATNGNLKWQVYDAGILYEYPNISVIDLPNIISPNAIITLFNGSDCYTTKRLGDDPLYIKSLTACATGSVIPALAAAVSVYPNPGTGIFKCQQNGQAVLANDILIYNSMGSKVATFSNTQQFNIVQLPAGIYYYQVVIEGQPYRGKLVKG